MSDLGSRKAPFFVGAKTIFRQFSGSFKLHLPPALVAAYSPTQTEMSFADMNGFLVPDVPLAATDGA